MESPGKFALLVVAGPQMSAQVELPSGNYKLGSNFDADIVIQDDKIGANSVQIEVSNQGVVVEVYPCEVDADHKDKKYAVHDLYQEIVVGESMFIIGVPGSDLWMDYSIKSVSGEITVPRDNNQKAKSGVFNLKAGAFIAVGVLFATAAVTIFFRNETGFDNNIAMQERQRVIDNFLNQEKYTDVSAVESNGATIYSGFVNDYSDVYSLKSKITSLNPNASFDLVVSNQIVDDVSNIFRTNGIEADVELMGFSSVQVTLKKADTNRKINRVKDLVLQDVSEITNIEIVFAKEDESNLGAEFLGGPGKRIIAVVQGDLSFLVTEDQSRYFIGSKLPSGFIISGITDESVELSRENERLDFQI